LRHREARLMGRNVVIWSGGVDSTWVLDHYAGVSSEDYPVVALSVAKHPNLSREHLCVQNEVQKRYLKHAKKKGYHIKHEIVSVSGSFLLYADTEKGLGQPLIWYSCLLPCVKDGDVVHFGYVRNDCFWHNRAVFENAFDSLCKLKGIEASLNYPLEWDRKVDVLERLRKAKVPNNCWGSCDYPKGKRSCGVCSKCESITDGRAKMVENDKRRNRQISEGKNKKRRK
jgi:7-cyano-7-deazaguanine synthase in queuosine biosynthesis